MEETGGIERPVPTSGLRPSSLDDAPIDERGSRGRGSLISTWPTRNCTPRTWPTRWKNVIGSIHMSWASSDVRVR